MDKKSKKRSSVIQTPTPGELDVLAAVYEMVEDQADDTPLRLTEIHERVGTRRASYGEEPPALTTVSSQLRSLVTKGLLLDQQGSQSGSAGQGVVRTRGMFSPSGRSSSSGYRPAYEVGELLRDSFIGLASAYPEKQRYRALVDFAKALDLPESKVKKLEKLLEEK